MSEIEIRKFTKVDLQKMGKLYQAVTSRDNAVFWWVGEEDNWPNVFIAVEEEQIIAKGQVSIVCTIPLGSPKEHKHYIYFNLKTLPEREADYHLYDLLYERLLNRAYELKETLPNAYRTMMGIGNQSTEKQNNNYFKTKGFVYRKSLYTMRRNLSETIEHPVLTAPYQCMQRNMATEDSVNEYLKVDMEIWPEAPIGHKRLMDNQKNSAWTAFVVREDATLIGSVMAWMDEDEDGIIEDVFVREPWRKQGIAKHLLSQALSYLKENGSTFAELQVETANRSALSLYNSVSFKEVSEEVRYEREL
ncbi:GNAT family N-acetyltransferase [Paenibacillus sp. HWE-109]|uniref:GNAT family N-acetyltransferase n=1 Tax=Paenibacillus sp. HWE-109 TaxID=1306526 RepID=UPI001EE097FE|nr:GNAT family N-acetyltransferase [Paenibacillus sp. HWE-109]UKS28070.1 GNAT family N-acetyltransferase [Paenibacillus sp. HWE-109]